MCGRSEGKRTKFWSIFDRGTLRFNDLEKPVPVHPLLDWKLGSKMCLAWKKLG